MYNQGVYNRAHLTGAGTTNLTTSAQFLHSININTVGTTVTIADTVGTIAVFGAITGCFVYNCKVSGTLTVTTTGTPDVTVSYL